MAFQQSKYGQCDSYFVDSVDDLLVRRQQLKDHVKQMARQKQKEMAEHLSLQTACDYQDDILEHMERMEVETMPDVNSIDIQTEIQWYMRPYLIDFLIEAHAAFQLLPETLYLTVNILDRYCSKRVVYKRHYQLVGCAALLIAAKYGDRKDRVPLIKELKSMCCSLYEDEMFTQMEWHVLLTLGWDIGHPTVDSFLQIALSEIPYDREVEHMSWYICEAALYHRDFVSLLPSTLARSALALARCILSKEVHEQSEWAAQYDPSVVVALSHKLGSTSDVLTKKYNTSQLSHASAVVYNFVQRQAQLNATAAAMASAPATPTVQTTAAAQHQQVAEVAMMEMMPVTPAKANSQHASVGHHGYATPPITPDHYNLDAYVQPQQQYVAQQSHLLVPSQHQQVQPQVQQHYQLPLPTPDEPGAQNVALPTSAVAGSATYQAYVSQHYYHSAA